MEAAGEGGRTAALAWHQYRRGPEEARGFCMAGFRSAVAGASISPSKGHRRSSMCLFVSSVPRSIAASDVVPRSFVWAASPIIVQNLILVRGTTLAVP